jgi:hypothetical protein
VLRPGGRLAAFWHAFEPPQDVAEALAVAYRRVVPDAPFDFRGTPKQADRTGAFFTTRTADGIREAGGFGDPERWQWDWERPYTRDEWLDLLPTSGALAQLPPDEVAQVLAGVGPAIDAIGGSFTLRVVTVALIAARTGAA